MRKKKIVGVPWLQNYTASVPEIGRSTREEAVGAVLKEHLYRYTLAEAFDGRPWTEVLVPVQSPEPIVEDADTKHILPSYIPSDTKLQDNEIILLSLTKLTDEEVCMLKQDMKIRLTRLLSTTSRTKLLRYELRRTTYFSV